MRKRGIHTKGCFRDKFRRHELEGDIYRCPSLIHVSEICLWNTPSCGCPFIITLLVQDLRIAILTRIWTHSHCVPKIECYIQPWRCIWRNPSRNYWRKICFSWLLWPQRKSKVRLTAFRLRSDTMVRGCISYHLSSHHPIAREPNIPIESWNIERFFSSQFYLVAYLNLFLQQPHIEPQ